MPDLQEEQNYKSFDVIKSLHQLSLSFPFKLNINKSIYLSIHRCLPAEQHYDDTTNSNLVPPHTSQHYSFCLGLPFCLLACLLCFKVLRLYQAEPSALDSHLLNILSAGGLSMISQACLHALTAMLGGMAWDCLANMRSEFLLTQSIYRSNRSITSSSS